MMKRVIDYIRMLPDDIAINVERAVPAEKLNLPYAGYVGPTLGRIIYNIIYTQFSWDETEPRLGLPAGYFCELSVRIWNNDIKFKNMDTNELI